MKKVKKKSLVKTIDEVMKIPDKVGNGILKFQMSVGEKGKIGHYSLAYINHRLCGVDNGRVLGCDNSHGYHHRHYMGKEELIEFENYDAIAERFDREWRILHEEVKKRYY